MLLTIFMVFAIILAVLVIVISLKPSNFCITRLAVISAPPEAVFEQVNDLHKWETWSPWAKLDPDAKNSYQGPPAGVGAEFAWSGNNQVGVGKMTITESCPYEFVRFKLEFLKPFTATNTAEFVFKNEGDQTIVSWSMSGESSFMAKVVGLVMNCEKMVGGQFEKGLADMKLVVESNKNK